MDPIFACAALAVVLVAAILLERKDRRHDRLVDRLLREIVHVREDALVERTSLLNRIAAPSVPQVVHPVGPRERTFHEQLELAHVAVRSSSKDAEEPEDEGELARVGQIVADGAYE